MHFQNFKEFESYIGDIGTRGSVLGLHNIRCLLEELGHPEQRLSVIHVGGTNGKGSTGAFITDILASAGYTVGRYVSPTILDYRERIQKIRLRSPDAQDAKGMLQCDFITEEELCHVFSQLTECIKRLPDSVQEQITAFEMETAAAFLQFIEWKTDYVVLEVGLGGKEDATNVIESPLCSVFTEISMDHMQMLGNSLAEIAAQKAGIIKREVPVISQIQKPEVTEVLKDACKKKNAPFYQIEKDSITVEEVALECTRFVYRTAAGVKEYALTQPGRYQVWNAALAVETVKVLQKSGAVIPEEAVQKGLYGMKWKGRFEIIKKEPAVIVDGAHNESAAYALADSVSCYFPNKKLYMIAGIFADKEYEKMLQILSPYAKEIYLIQAPLPRGADSAVLTECAERYFDKAVNAKTFDYAWRAVSEKAGKDDAILIFGSLSILGQVYSLTSQ